MLAGQIALVTGASRGIGQAIAHELGKQGACIVGTATSTSGAQAISAGLADAGIEGWGAVLDVTDSDSISALMAELGEREQMPGILVNNAGITRDNLLVRMPDDDWDAIISTNLSSVYRLSKACLRHMMKKRTGRIITIASVVGSMGNAGQTNYAAAKAGAMGFSRALAREVGIRAITVNSIAPGFIDTDMTRGLPAEQRDRLISQIPLNRLGSVTDVANAAVFLASPMADYITGETLHVNGGMYMA